MERDYNNDSPQTTVLSTLIRRLPGAILNTSSGEISKENDNETD